MKNKSLVQLYNHKIVAYLEPYLHKMLPFGFLALLLSIINLLMDGRGGSLVMAVDAVFLGVIALLWLRKNISAQYKIALIVSMLFVIGLVAIFEGLYVSNGFYIITLSIIFAMIFSTKVVSLSLIAISLIFYGSMYYRISREGSQLAASLSQRVSDPGTLIFHVLGFGILALVAYVSVMAIKEFLIKNILALEEQVDRLHDNNQELKKQSKQIEYMAYYDQNTELPNRALLNKMIQMKLDAGQIGTLLILDIEKFVKINSFYGVKKGDKILKEIASFLKEKVTEDCTIGYLGANSFGLWYAEIPTEEAIVSRIRTYEEDLNAYLSLFSPIRFYSSIIPCRHHNLSLEQLYKFADISLEQMKREKTQRYFYYTEKTYRQLQDAEALRLVIERAIKEKKFTISYQEKVHSETGQVLGIEALARLVHENQPISPGVFIPIIENNGLMEAFGWMIIELVFSEYQDILDHYGDQLHIGINVSPSQLSSHHFAGRLQEYLAHYQVDPSHIEIELTENVLVDNLEEAYQIIEILRGIGVQIAIDDFGVGYSSLHYITSLPIDVLKIDKSFVDNLLTDKRVEAVVAAIINIATAAGFDVVAEGVETPNQRDKLLTLGCTQIQGYLYSQPAPIKKGVNNDQ